MPKIPDYNDLIGTRSGKLLIKKYLGLRERPNGRKQSYYLCLCDCGNRVEVPRSQLIDNHKVSCANCRRIEKIEDGFRYYVRSGEYFEFDEEDYVSIIPEDCRWRNWAVDDGKGTVLTGVQLLDFVNNTLFPTLKGLDVDADTPIKMAIVKSTFEDANQ